MPRFTLYRDGAVVESVLLEGDKFSIGRHPDADLRLDAQTVSRWHALIRKDGASWIVEDKGSVNGFSVGGTRHSRHVLAPGDRIDIEKFSIVFEPPEDVFTTGLAPNARDQRSDVALKMTYVSTQDILRRQTDATVPSSDHRRPPGDDPNKR